MPVNEFHFKRKIGGVAYYCNITLDVILHGRRELQVIIDELQVEQEWHPAIEFGIRYFYEHYKENNKYGLTVSVTKLHTMVVDSSYAVVFYTTVQCLSDALGYKERLVSLCEKTGKFEIVK